MRLLFSLFLLICFSCQTPPDEKIRIAGKKQVCKINQLLEKIETIDQLKASSPSLKKRFLKLAQIIQRASEYPHLQTSPTIESEELFAHLARLYEMPGGKELIEKAQSEALELLEKDSLYQTK